MSKVKHALVLHFGAESTIHLIDLVEVPFGRILPGTCLICPRSPYVKQRRLHGRGACSGLGSLQRSERGW